MYEQKFAERLSALRLQKGVSARDMSLSIGQNSGYINHIENRQTLPSLPVFFNICDYLSVTPEEFFASDFNHPETVKRIVKDLSQLSAEQVQYLSAIIHDIAPKK